MSTKNNIQLIHLHSLTKISKFCPQLTSEITELILNCASCYEEQRDTLKCTCTDNVYMYR